MLQQNKLEGELLVGPWFQFYDQNGLGHCQPDHLVVQENKVLCLESKLTYTDVAKGQLIDLYQPVLEMFYGLPIVLVQVCKYLHRGFTIPEELRVYDLNEITPDVETVYIWHQL